MIDDYHHLAVSVASEAFVETIVELFAGADPHREPHAALVGSAAGNP